jgi:hypothetical protein
MKLHSFKNFVNESKKSKKSVLDDLFGEEETVKLPKKKPAKKAATSKKMDQDGDGDSDFADAKIAQYKAGGMDKKKAFNKSRKFNK